MKASRRGTSQMVPSQPRLRFGDSRLPWKNPNPNSVMNPPFHILEGLLNAEASAEGAAVHDLAPSQLDELLAAGLVAWDPSVWSPPTLTVWGAKLVSDMRAFYDAPQKPRGAFVSAIRNPRNLTDQLAAQVERRLADPYLPREDKAGFEEALAALRARKAVGVESWTEVDPHNHAFATSPIKDFIHDAWTGGAPPSAGERRGSLTYEEWLQFQDVPRHALQRERQWRALPRDGGMSTEAKVGVGVVAALAVAIGTAWWLLREPAPGGST